MRGSFPDHGCGRWVDCGAHGSGDRHLATNRAAEFRGIDPAQRSCWRVLPPINQFMPRRDCFNPRPGQTSPDRRSAGAMQSEEITRLIPMHRSALARAAQAVRPRPRPRRESAGNAAENNHGSPGRATRVALVPARLEPRRLVAGVACSRSIQSHTDPNNQLRVWV